MMMVDEGGVEEKKEDFASENPLSPKSLRNKQSSAEQEEDEEQTHGFQAQWHAFTSTLFGTCGVAIEAASNFMQQQGCRWPLHMSSGNAPNDGGPPPLSIAEELRKLAMRDGRARPHGTRSADIPKFLGEEHVYSFEDDNISALSQNTLEEMAKRNGTHHRRRTGAMMTRPSRSQSNDEMPPSPMRTKSSSTESSPKDKYQPIQNQRTDDLRIRGIS